MLTTPMLTKADLADYVCRALATCPDIDCDEAVMRHLHLLGICTVEIGASELDGLIDEARACRETGR